VSDLIISKRIWRNGVDTTQPSPDDFWQTLRTSTSHTCTTHPKHIWPCSSLIEKVLFARRRQPSTHNGNDKTKTILHGGRRLQWMFTVQMDSSGKPTAMFLYMLYTRGRDDGYLVIPLTKGFLSLYAYSCNVRGSNITDRPPDWRP